ncbi:hypothetical protein ZYGR_0N03710 [Zygosaccharomyces rouxii]|uniref:ZYRO0D08822p n=2 Tax=Zygosaccharomyces rouxii TaxID=4956 RepID=C5DVR5_ZYGRC|nr:uncharacterized protein ZYRO0D08822g [Zygosaccharomyces rouxii]KAH9200796.1 putative subtilase-type proteinase [Zygosaccharomyces rouxii]CAQ43285.1 Putative subtilase-type proteinase YCR045C [Zygosaccharomyces rouxii]CAQ43573.1 Putative subtilase-type proteinase YCR045C [Zygosaccharomyces rouxii]CAR27884.1 ZYRO0D08822p [Zygosaccharomyces rouxii]GAV48966.1 hypothetical protein ZYGR_0N03710 [Zygosaccharomyces rouxii]
MRFSSVLLSLLIGSASAEEYLIRFKSPDGFQFFMNSAKDHTKNFKEFFHNKISHTFSFGSFRGITVDISQDVVEKIRNNPLVADLVPNIQFKAFDDVLGVQELQQNYHGDNLDDEDGFNPFKVKVQGEAPRHLARLSRRAPLPYEFDDELRYEESFNYYYYKWHKGRNINAYIIDTGIYKEHKDFCGRAIFGRDFTGEGPGDRNGHGTHVAGIVGSSNFGVAKKVNLIEVKALNNRGQGNLTTVISAVEFAVNHCKSSGKKGCVANLSLGAVRNSVINQAIKAAHEAGLIIVVAAGNSNINACWNSPASAPEAITVGAFDDRTDTIAKFSNWGPCVDIFASGVKVKSLSAFPPHKPIAFSGTSMASPSVTGLVAILLDKGVEPENIKAKLVELATHDLLQRRTLFFKPGTPNRIAFNGMEREDDEYDDAVYPIVDLESLVQELQNYQPPPLEVNNKDGKFDIINFKDDSPLPMGTIDLTKRKILSPGEEN